MNRSVKSLAAAAAIAALAILFNADLQGQGFARPGAPRGPGAKSWLAERAKLPPFSPPRTADGRPNLQGRWGGSSSGDDVEETEMVDPTTPPWESHVSNPADGKIPYQPWALAERIRHRRGLARGVPGETGERLYADPQTYCMKSVPRYAQRGYELVQSPDYVVMMLNWGHFHRRIPLTDRPRPASTARFWMGIPRGRWDGDTLVIETTNFNGKMWLDSVGNFVSENVRVTERLRLVHANILDYEVTIDDPTVFTQPWTLSYDLRRAGTGGGGGGGGAALNDPYAAESWEHACHEGNSHHVEGTKKLGFKWFPGVRAPGAR
jgi:hypothetical protein